MSALLDSLVAGHDGDPARRAALDAVLRDGLPDSRSEVWKYTSLRALERRAFGAATTVPEIDARVLEAIPAPRIVFVNGLLDEARSAFDGLPAGVELRTRQRATTPSAAAGKSSEVFSRLNAILGDSGVRLSVSDRVDVPVAIHLVFVGATAPSDCAWHLRNSVELGADSRLDLVEHYVASGTHAHFGNHHTRVDLGVRARLTHARVLQESTASTCLLRTEATLDTLARYERIDLELGAGLSRHELDVRLDGEGAALVANGVQLALGRSHLDTRLGIRHSGRDTSSQLTWRGLGAGRGRVVFRGGIAIDAGADGSDANLSSRNLLLSVGAEVDTQPLLEIHADEVKAAHGATVGQLDANAVFYLRSRGLPEADARRLLTAAFCREPLGIIREDSLRQSFVAALDAAVAGLVVG